MYKSGRPHNSIWENILHATIGNQKHPKSVIISKLTMLSECKSSTQKVQWIQFLQHQLSEYFPTIFTLNLGNSKAFKLVFYYRILRGSVELNY